MNSSHSGVFRHLESSRCNHKLREQVSYTKENLPEVSHLSLCAMVLFLQREVILNFKYKSEGGESGVDVVHWSRNQHSGQKTVEGS